jgi:hypothetical protein
MFQFERCFVMLCDDQTEDECVRRNLFGDKAKRLDYYDDVKPGDLGLLLNVNRDELIGIFRARSKAQLHIEPDAWDRRFAAQIRVELIGKLQRIKDAAYILGNVGIAMTQLKSGAPAPQFPVYGRDVVEKILAHFREPIT